MRILIAYRTKYGTAASCARTLAEEIGGDTALADLADARDVNVRDYDVVLVGGSVYGGKLQRKVPAFCERNRDLLLKRPVGVFLCCLYQGEEAAVQMQSAFPDWLLAHAFARVFPGGEIRYAQLTLLDKLLVRGVIRSLATRTARGAAHPVGDISRMRPEALDELADAVKSLPRR